MKKMFVFTLLLLTLTQAVAFAALTFAREKLRNTANTTGDFATKPKTTSPSAQQNQNSTFTCSLSKENQSFVAHGGSGIFSVTTGSTGPLTVTSNVDWITIDVPVQFSVKPNTDSNDRSGTITVGDKVFTVDQKGTATPIGARPSTGQSSTKAKAQ